MSTCTEPATREEYERRYMENHRITGYGIEGVTNHFPCPFCAEPDWHVVRVIEFAAPEEPGEYSTEPMTCSCCGRSARYVSRRGADGSVAMGIEQTGGEDPPPWVPIARRAA